MSSLHKRQQIIHTEVFTLTRTAPLICSSKVLKVILCTVHLGFY